MLPWESRRKRRSGRAGCRGGLRALEPLEQRELLAYTPMGYSLPELTVSGYTSTVAAWGGPLTVTVNVSNLGAETFPEPFNLQPGATGSADAGPTTVDVFVSKSPHATAKNSVLVGVLAIPAVHQNDMIQQMGTITLPTQPPGFPGDGGNVYVSFAINTTGSVNEAAHAGVSRSKQPVLIEAPFPELDVTAIDVPPVMQPGDTIAPTIRIANFGPAATDLQGPLTVDLVASTNKKFTSGSSVLATYTVANIPAMSQVSSGAQVFSDANLVPQNNTVTITGAPVTLPISPSVYYIGVVVDPNNTIKQISGVGGIRNSTTTLSLPQRVGPPINGLPAAGVLYAGGGVNNLPFPYPANVTSTTSTTTNPQAGVNF